MEEQHVFANTAKRSIGERASVALQERSAPIYVRIIGKGKKSMNEGCRGPVK
jgi:hypothetical protein